MCQLVKYVQYVLSSGKVLIANVHVMRTTLV